MLFVPKMAAFSSCLHLLPELRPLSVCLTGECVERLSVWMLLLPPVLAPGFQRAEEKSSLPRFFVLFSQIRCFNLPAGGAFGLDRSGTLSQCAGADLITGLQPLPVRSEYSTGTQCVLKKRTAQFVPTFPPKIISHFSMFSTFLLF